MFNDFVSAEALTTFAGLVAATNLVVQFTKGPIKDKWGDGAVRLYSFIIAVVLNATFTTLSGAALPQVIILTIINSIVVTMAALGSYEVIVDPKAEKTRKK